MRIHIVFAVLKWYAEFISNKQIDEEILYCILITEQKVYYEKLYNSRAVCGNRA